MADQMLIEKGAIHTRNLYTIRKGEKVRDNILNGLITADADIIKIKGTGDTWTCRFYDPANKACTIYGQRPLECRVLKCWDTKDIKALYNKERLKREDLLKDIEGLWMLIEDHGHRCSYEKISRAIKGLEGNFQKAAVAGIMEMVRYDTEIRNLVVEKGNMEADMTDFLFGRPLTKTISMYGYRVKMADGRYLLRKGPA
jgi:Fe-S-cluster containining protein